MHVLQLVCIGCGITLWSLFGGPQDQDKKSPNRYVGATTCKGCHVGAEKGDAYNHWTQTGHAKAFETLASDAAKEVGKKLGIDDPQKSEKCLRCHVTAFGVAKELVKASLKPANGVQCETCHGPGEAHQKKRMAEAMKKDAAPSPVTADEIRSERTIETCKQCHNEESPTFKPFCLSERMTKVEHLDPRKQRSAEDLAKLHASCTPDCKVCGGKGAAAPAAGKEEPKR